MKSAKCPREGSFCDFSDRFDVRETDLTGARVLLFVGGLSGSHGARSPNNSLLSTAANLCGGHPTMSETWPSPISTTRKPPWAEEIRSTKKIGFQWLSITIPHFQARYPLLQKAYGLRRSMDPEIGGEESACVARDEVDYLGFVIPAIRDTVGRLGNLGKTRGVSCSLADGGK
jgi:hypothetical protein